MTDTDRQVRPFAEIVRDIGRGALHDELSEAIQTVAEAVEDTGKTGTITMKLTFKKTKSDLGPQVEITDAVVVKPPAAQRDPSRFFVTADGNLTRSNPRQAELDFTGPREVPAPPQDAPREVPDAPAAPTGTNG